MSKKLNLTSDESLMTNSKTTSNEISSREHRNQKIHFFVGIDGDVIFWIVCIVIHSFRITMCVTWVWLTIILKDHRNGVMLMNYEQKSRIGSIWIRGQYNTSRFHVDSRRKLFLSIRVLLLATLHSGIRFRCGSYLFTLNSYRFKEFSITKQHLLNHQMYRNEISS